MHRADNIFTLVCRMSRNCESLDLLEPLGPVQTCVATAFANQLEPYHDTASYFLLITVKFKEIKSSQTNDCHGNVR